MKPRSSQKVLIALLLLVGATAIWWFSRQPVVRSPEPLTRQSPKKTTPAAISPEVSVQPPTAKAVAPVPPPADNRVEIAATQRMYAAHAPLRVPSVADPDSIQNREILQTMVLKAMSRAGEKPPAKETPH